jgi:PEP-CTERM motif
MPPIRAALALAIAFLAAPAGAVTNVQVQLGVNPNFSGGTGALNTVLTQPSSAELSSGLVTGGFNSSGTAHAYAEIGTLKVDGTSVGSLNSVARASFRDDFKLDLPGVAANTQVTVNFQLLLDGSLSVGSSNIGSASWQVRADMGGGAYDLGGDATLYNNSPALGTHGYVGTPLGTLTGTATFLTGHMLPLSVELTAAAQTANDGHGGALATAAFDLSHTLRWGGMTVSLNGVPQSQVMLTSASGFDYLQAAPVPEPGTLALMLAGIALLRFRRRAG